MFMFLKVIALIVVSVLSLMLVRTNQLLWTQDQTDFSSGTVGDSLPEGFYAGTIRMVSVSWQGKTFTPGTHSGMNVFLEQGGAKVLKYPFTYAIAPGVYDNKQVIQIDYNLKENPLWLRPVLDEIVRVSPDTYLGKLQLRIIPGYPFTLIYFRLQKAT